MFVNSPRYSDKSTIKSLMVFGCAFLCHFAYADEDCATGFKAFVKHKDSIVPTLAGECPDGYEKYQQDYAIAHTAARSVTHCPTGQHYVDGSCVSYQTGACDAGFVDSGTNAVSTFTEAYSGDCMGGYQPILTRRGVSYVIFKPTDKCGFGYHPTPDGCVENPRDDCPDNYYSVLPSNAFNRRNTESECDTDYTLYDENTTLCHIYLGGTPSEVCTPLCEIGYNHTHADTCASYCNVPGMSQLYVGQKSFPLYANKTTSPALHVRWNDNDVCYANLVSGTANGTLNLRTNNGALYRVVE